MNTQNKNTCIVALTVATAMQFGMLTSSAQTADYLYSGSETTINLNPGTYDITAYGAQGGNDGGQGAEISAQFSFSASTPLTLLVGGGGASDSPYNGGGGGGGSFVVEGSTPLVIAGGGGGGSYNDLALLSGLIGTSGGGYGGGAGGANGSGGYAGSTFDYGGGGGGGGYSGNGGGGGYSGNGGSSFVSGGGGGNGNGYASGGYGGGGAGVLGGGGGGGYSGGGGGGEDYGGNGGGSIIDSSATMVLAEVSGVASPDDSPNGEIIINEVSEVPEPTSLSLLGFGVVITFLHRRCPAVNRGRIEHL